MRFVALLFACCCALFSEERLEFEVVAVKPSAPPGPNGMRVGCHGGPGTDDPALLVCQNLDLFNLVCMAHGINYFQLSAPDWMRDVRYDVRAKVPEGTTKEQVKAMWQNLMADRFKLVVHSETREIQSYELALAKGGPKFKKAGDALQSDESGNSALDRKLDADGYPPFRRGHPGMGMGRGFARMYFPSVTMGRMAGQVSGQLGKPVNDATGLQGQYEIGLYWVSDGFLEQTPDAGPSLVQALRDQLGLRLESKKGPVEFLVVDHAERVPSDN
jgi:uncharacterized protein (TIGR03435 family)